MEEVLDRIRIIPLVQVLLSEETIAARATTLAKYLEHDGAQKDPIIVTPANESYIVLDGMHRVEALRILGCVDILAYCVDYENHKISLQSWDGLVDPQVRLVELLGQEFGGPEHAIERVGGLAAARERVASRTAHFALCPGPTEGWLLRPREVRGAIPCGDLIYTLEHWEARLDREGIAIRYVADTRSEAQLREPGVGALVVRPGNNY